MISKYLLILSLCSIQLINAQQFHIPDSLKNKDFDYLFDRIEDGNNTTERRSLYLLSFLIKAKAEENWEELSNAYKNYVHYAPEMLKLKYADSMVIAAKRSKSNEIIGSAYLSKGIAYYGQKRLSEAMDIYLVADDYIKKTNDKYLIYKTKYYIGQIKLYLGYYEEAIAIFQECISHFKNTNVRAYLNSLHSLGVCYNKVGNYGLCTSVNETGIAYGIKTGNLDMKPYFIHSEGVNQSMLHNYAIGIEKIQSSLPDIRENKDFSNETVGYFYIGKSYWGLNDKEKALVYFEKVDKSFIDRGYIRPDLREAYELMISYYKDKNMLPEQLRYVEKLLEVDKKLHVTYAHLQGKIRKEYDTKELVQEQQKLKDSLNNRKYNDEIFISIIGVMILIIVYGIVRHFKNKKEARKKYEKLLQKIEDVEKARASKGDDTDFSISKNAEEAVLQRLQKFENSKKFLEKDLNLTKLASYFNTNTKYLSLIIARHRNKKFNEYINSLKVDNIAQRIRNDKVLQNYTHDALAEEAGFSTTRRFAKSFLLYTGITPKYFIEELKMEDMQN
ncbi:helix-turn-helix domain-containing protein [Flavobacterium sp. ALJ2]|uniref:tetratricopeptide repeat protein n=1 Tax=Flavobacterium sp. ALJ2 TaxID=2786960 RepID=UPI00189F0FF3|nr:tetratricopeptide repeat protein [Flavobacterium sp. ALJ2]MBF7092619.1 helix-turn-helix domain-containing protein [Flavobacterium sp. ALJ2]